MEIQGVKKIIEITPKKAAFILDTTPLEITGENLELLQLNNDTNKIKIKGIGTKKNILLGLSEKKITINDAQVILHKQIMEGINENISIN